MSNNPEKQIMKTSWKFENLVNLENKGKLADQGWVRFFGCKPMRRVWNMFEAECDASSLPASASGGVGAGNG